ncbi:MAG: 1-(5-phosphoribosyl)-5-[(5-phosphoribosylamino)methylideneamino]imidazole-4-carboxamide isomerase [Erysipelotrichia bacterium]|nr:1-(5-phosphoribosyl)-5-[(5-phosphoribosylamino)methylideneamino]imidazole-4-carboxamide isomerase [Erysipelotrichia bacterium]NCC54314.1 1-(5-phosphoribosyl)-5-[(5-phosphoribosylamino)methylideneamino]imidazole-4-carboxamide isomerase [Erysipelotrichia bacterium]
MIIIPAIDIINHEPVRLYQGDYLQKEVVGQSVLELAKTFEKEGASYLHLVDLDGAKEGNLINQSLIVDVAKALSIPVEVGGGIRTMEAISYYLEQGVERVILGTSAMEDETLLTQAMAKYGKRIAVGIDCKDGYVYGRGWLEASHLHYLDFAKTLENKGVQTIIVTDITKDGTLSGPNVEMLKQLKESVSMDIVASGGIKDIEDIQALKQLGLYAAITGKAMYHKTLDLKSAISLCKGE